jgi:hypothetical protein
MKSGKLDSDSPKRFYTYNRALNQPFRQGKRRIRWMRFRYLKTDDRRMIRHNRRTGKIRTVTYPEFGPRILGRDGSYLGQIVGRDFPWRRVPRP